MPKQKMVKRAEKIQDMEKKLATLKAGRDEIKAIKLKIAEVKAQKKKMK